MHWGVRCADPDRISHPPSCDYCRVLSVLNRVLVMGSVLAMGSVPIDSVSPCVPTLSGVIVYFSILFLTAGVLVVAKESD